MDDTAYTKTFDQIASLLGHYATVTLNNKKEIKGYLYTIDPVTRNVVLFDVEQQRVQVAMNGSIQDLKIEENDSIDLQAIDKALNYHKEGLFTKEWLNDRRQRLIAHFEKNRIPIQHQENEPVIHVLGCARVESPYAATSVVCDNVLIRKRVRDLVLDFN